MCRSLSFFYSKEYMQLLDDINKYMDFKKFFKKILFKNLEKILKILT